VSGAKHFHKKTKRQRRALEFFLAVMNAPVDMICIENPVCVASSHIREPDQIIQPWMFGDSFQKRTCLWLKNLPCLKPTKIVDKGEIHVTAGGKKIPQWYSKNTDPKNRSRTFPGMARAMARQWDRPRKRGFGIYVPYTMRRRNG
jgi:hypothetical protein